MDTSHCALSILLVEDNANLRESIIEALSSRGHHVRGIDCAEALPEQDKLSHLDLAILDLNLPGEDGISLATRLRKSHPHLGIIMLTARVHTDDRARGYAYGADIYLTKPASLQELEQAIGALVRRMALSAPSPLQDQHPSVRLQVRSNTLTDGKGTDIALTVRETQLLVAFIRAEQNMLEIWQIAELLRMDVGALNKPALELHIVRLRKKLTAIGTCAFPIKAIRGRGYQLCFPLVVGNPV